MTTIQVSSKADIVIPFASERFFIYGNYTARVFLQFNARGDSFKYAIYLSKVGSLQDSISLCSTEKSAASKISKYFHL